MKPRNAPLAVPDALKFGLTAQCSTEQAAEPFGILADGLCTGGIELRHDIK